MKMFLALCGAVLCFAAVAAAGDTPLAPATSNSETASATSALPEAPSAAPAATPAPARSSGTRRARAFQEYSWQLGISYAYERVRPNGGETFHLMGISTHIAYYFTNSIGLKGVVEPLFGTTPATLGSFNTAPSLKMRQVFFGGGPVYAFHNSSRLEPWVHGLFGGVHLRLTQTAALPGTVNTFAFQGGGGVDYKIRPRLYWRAEGDYFGTRYFSKFQHNFAFKTGIVFNF